MGELVFKVSFWKFFVFVVGYSLLGDSIIILPDWITTRRGGYASILSVLFFVVAVSFLLVAIVRQVWKVVVSASGIDGQNAWGFALTLTWQEIKTTRPFNFGGLRYLRLYSSQTKRVMWLPLFLQDKKGFKAAVTQFAPPENPLRRYLEASTE